jgi:hypothetical protein
MLFSESFGIYTSMQDQFVSKVLQGEILATCVENLQCTRIYEQMGLDVLPVGYWWEGKVTPPVELVVAQKKQISEILTSLHVPIIEDLQERINQLIPSISDLSIAEAIVFLATHPRTDTENNYELPEVATLEGALLGYEPCCIKYWVETRSLGILPIASDEDNRSDRFTRCPDCVASQII